MFRSLLNWLQSWTHIHQFLSEGTPVGTVDLRVPHSVPFMIYYPAAPEVLKNKSISPRSWFRNTIGSYMAGYLFVLRPLSKRPWLRILIELFVRFILVFLPLNYFRVPGLYGNVKSVSGTAHEKRYPLIVFSHGLTGTSEEHAAMFVHLVQQGFIVAALTHCDGSSSAATLHTGERLYYQHPDYKAYDVDFRPKQVKRREEEFYSMKTFILESTMMPREIQSLIDQNQVFAMGFSYGAATAALSLIRHPKEYKAAVLLDGWFSIDFSTLVEGGGILPFPREVHDSPKGLPVPSCFVGSEQFDRIEHLSNATKELARKSLSSESHILAASKHQNFTDVGFWVPARLLQLIQFIGKTNYHETYSKILSVQVQFLKKHVC